MVPMHGQNDLEAFHEPPRPSNRSLLWESGAEDARTPDASRPPGVSEPREASGVRPIYRRFWSGPDVHRFMLPMPAQKRKGARMSEVTRILNAVQQGDAKAAEEMIP